MTALSGLPRVGGVGPTRPRYIIVGEAPGEEEVAQGVPFVGVDGKILDGILKSAGIDRRECYITNVVKVRAPKSKVANLYQLGLKPEDFYDELRIELSQIECNLCIPLGDIALNAVCGKDSISKHRGSIYPSNIRTDLTCVPTLHPGFVRELWAARGVVVGDLKKAIRIARDGYAPVTFNTKLYPTWPEVEAFIMDLESIGEVSFDIEVVGQPAQIACIGVGGRFNDKRRSMCIPFKHGYKNYWTELEERMIWQWLTRLFHNPEVLKIGQFITYDLSMLQPFIGLPTGPWFDCNVAHHTLDPELPHTLAFMTSTYTDVPYYKDDPKEEGETWKNMTSSEVLWEYNGKDVEIPLILETLMTDELRSRGLLDFFRGYQMSVMRALLRMSQRGMLIDEAKRQELLDKRMEEIADKQAKLDLVVGEPINVNSSKQMQHLLYDKLKLPIQYHRKTHKPTLNEEAINKLAAKYDNPIFQLALDLRGLVKETGTYLMAQVSADGRMRGAYNPCGTETGRSSCKKYTKKEGLDLQNVPADVRGMFVAGEGRTFVMVDLWQAEAYCVAVYAKVPAFLAKLQKHEKIHSMIGAWLFEKPESELTPDEYAAAKKVVHGSDYGVGPNTMSIQLKLPLARTKQLSERFHALAPEIRVWHKSTQFTLEQTRKLITPFGRQRIFRGRWGDEMFREAYAHLPQSTIADYLHHAQIKLEYMLDALGGKIVQEGFDSLVIECPDDRVDDVIASLSVAFDKTLYWEGEFFKVPYDIQIGERWKK